METMKGKGTKRVTREHVAALHDKARCIASAIVETGRQHIPLLVTAALHDCDGDNCGYGDSELVAQRMRQLDFTTEEKKDEMALVMRRELARPEVDALLFISEAWIATVPAKEGMEGVASLMRAGGVSKAANRQEVLLVAVYTKDEHYQSMNVIARNNGTVKVRPAPLVPMCDEASEARNEMQTMGGRFSLLH